MKDRAVYYTEGAVRLIFDISDDYGLTVMQRKQLMDGAEQSVCEYHPDAKTITVYRIDVEYALQHSPIRERLPVRAGARKAGIRPLDP